LQPATLGHTTIPGPNAVITKSHLAIDAKLLEEALQLGGSRSKTGAATRALKEFIQRHKQLKLLDLFGTIKYEDAGAYNLAKLVTGRGGE
jgi:hypothetical protein